MKRIGFSGRQTAGVWLAVLLVYLMISAGCSNPLEEQKEVFNLRLFPSKVVVVEGDETTVSVWVDQAKGLIATRFILSFDPSMAEVKSITTGGIDDIFVNAGASVLEIEKLYDNEAGRIVVGVGAQQSKFTGASGSGSIVDIVFTSKTPGKSNINFVNVNPDDIVTTGYSATAETGWKEFQVEVFNAELNVVENVTDAITDSLTVEQ